MIHETKTRELDSELVNLYDIIIIINLFRHTLSRETYFHRGPNINIIYNTTLQIGDPGKNLREQTWIGKPFAHTARNGN